MVSPIRPEPGLVIRYDFLFHREQQQGRDSGKDRPTAIVLALPQKSGSGHNVIVVPITHSPPSPTESAIPLSKAVARQMGLDDRPMWIKPRELNRFVWNEEQIPFGMMPVKLGQWSYGHLPPNLFSQLREVVVAEIKASRASITSR